MNVMVALVGGQPLPNLLPVRQDKPAGVLLVHTQRTAPVAQRLSATLQGETQVFEVETEAYDIQQIIDVLGKRLRKNDLTNASPVFNLTGGTKSMAFAAYQVARQQAAPVLYLESEGKQSRIYTLHLECEAASVS